MGVLTNPKTRQKFVSFISNHNAKLCVLCYIIGVGWFLALAYKPMNASTYFSENALLPGLVEAHFHHDFGAADILQSLRNELKSKQASKTTREAAYHIPTDWLETQFRSLGLDTYVQNYTFRYPVGILPDQEFSGQNVYGILRAPKTASTEAIVLSAPYRPLEAAGEKTNNGIALMIALAKSFRRHTYWAKDVIFLVTEQEYVGMQAWLGAYHNDHNEYIKAGELHGRSGSIQAALNLEIGQDSISRLNIKIEGLNGQLPNLDLVNTVARLCRRESIPPAFQRRVDIWDLESWEGFEHSLKTMASMMWYQARGSPTGNHGLFHRYQIEAVTLQGIRMKNSRKTGGYLDMGRIIEGVCRSLNNLLERFHQSFFFYLLPATDRYVSIGLYMPPFGILTAPILIKAIALWIASSYNEETSSKAQSSESDTESKEKETESDSASKEKVRKEKKSKSDSDSKEKVRKKTKSESDSDSKDKVRKKTKSESDSDSKEKVRKKTKSESDSDSKDKVKKDLKSENKNKQSKNEEQDPELSESKFMALMPTCIMSIFFGLAALYGPKYYMDTARPFKMQPTEALLWGAMALQISAKLFPWVLRRKAAQKGDVCGPDPRLLKCVGLLAVAVILAATSVMNISLAFFVTVAWTPVFLMTYPSKSRLLTALQFVLLVVVSPLGLLFLASGVAASVQPFTTVPDLLAQSWNNARSALLTAVVDSHLLGSLTYPLASLAMFPCWLIFWSLLWTEQR